MNPDCADMLILRSKIDERFFPVIMMLFDRLGVIDSVLTKEMKNVQRESC
jgi:hypothetical protein